MSDYDPGLKYSLADCLAEEEIAADPARLADVRRQLAADLADYPGVLVWDEAVADGVRTITGTKYPPEYAARAIARRRRGQDAA